MHRLKDSLPPLYEAHVRLTCDGRTLHADGLPEGPDTVPLPGWYCSGLSAIFHLLESMLPSITCISVLGIWHQGEDPVFCALDLWAQTGEEGFYLPMSSAAMLFQQNGIPYYHKPVF